MDPLASHTILLHRQTLTLEEQRVNCKEAE